MNEREFCYWLNGFFDLTPDNDLSEEQVQVLREHLLLVFDQQVKLVQSREFDLPNYNQPIC